MARTVVLIDDDQDDLDIMKEIISDLEGPPACIAFTYPDEALRAVLHEGIISPDFIFIDLNMPAISGDKVLREFRKNAAFDKAVISIFSTSMPPGSAAALKAIGANHTFQKPSRIVDYKRIVVGIMGIGSVDS